MMARITGSSEEGEAPGGDRLAASMCSTHTFHTHCWCIYPAKPRQHPPPIDCTKEHMLQAVQHHTSPLSRGRGRHRALGAGNGWALACAVKCGLTQTPLVNIGTCVRVPSRKSYTMFECLLQAYTDGLYAAKYDFFKMYHCKVV